ncbi:acyltransferase family protein [[Clostridium] innocuum]|nr:acyltransferase family protein [[Clostridium] innocuum]
MKKRDMHLEFIRVLSCAFVIILHVSNFYRRNLIIDVINTSYIVSLVINVITRISVPLFFMISGALLMNRKITFSLKRIKIALIPLLGWSVVYGLWEIFFKDTSVHEVVDIVYDPVTKHLWYMYVMIGIYIALPYMQTLYQNLAKEAKRNFLLMWFAILLFTYVSSFFHLELAYEIPFIGGSSYYFGYFMLGAYLYEYKLDINKYFTGIGCAVCLTYLCVWALMSDNVEKVLYIKKFKMKI